SQASTGQDPATTSSGTRDRHLKFDVSAPHWNIAALAGFSLVVGNRLPGNSKMSVRSKATLPFAHSGNRSPERSVRLMDASGKMQVLPAMPAQYLNPRGSPDGSRIAVKIIEASGTNLRCTNGLRTG